MAESAAAAVLAKSGKYLTFKLGAEEFGLEILKVQEIIGMMKVTAVPGAPSYVRGVINLRGKVIAVVDLRLKFGMESLPNTEHTCIIVVQVKHRGGQLTIGALVDDVSEVLDVKADQIEPPPDFGASVSTDFILGMGKVGQKVVMLLDVDCVLAHGQADAVAGLAA